MASKTPHKFALGTTVPVTKTRIEIEDLLKRAGATSFMNAQKEGLAMFQFFLRGRTIRVLLLTIKAKLESVRDETVETFEEAFLAQTVPPDGGPTVAERMLPQLAEAYRTGRPPEMFLQLPAPAPR